MILIAPDKYRGTMSARVAAGAMARAFARPCVVVPMADGGEGTAACVADGPGWQQGDGPYFVNRITGEAVVESAAVVGYGCAQAALPPMERTTAPLGSVLNDIYSKHRPRRIYVAVGGTCTCDGGLGLLRTLDRRYPWAQVLAGLVDVKVPLLAADAGQPSTLMFCRQKGFTLGQLPLLQRRLADVERHYGPAVSPFDGAGGGLGYALASAIGAECHLGAQWLLKRAAVDWEQVRLVVTGEGCFDAQTSCGKVVSVLADEASARCIPAVVFAGCVGDDAAVMPGLSVVDTSVFPPVGALTASTARLRLEAAVIDYCNKNDDLGVIVK